MAKQYHYAVLWDDEKQRFTVECDHQPFWNGNIYDTNTDTWDIPGDKVEEATDEAAYDFLAQLFDNEGTQGRARLFPATPQGGN
jgi:hypothetical protein